jgi:2-oxoglutarate/2-oxoacid ferredoxin oxidoreductase subunit alpha
VTTLKTLDRVVIRFAGDSGDGMQLTGDRFTSDTVFVGNDFATMPAFPAEIRAPQGTVAGVSSFQLHFAGENITTPGDQPDVLVAMNPAALRANLHDLRRGGILIADAGAFTPRNLAKVGYATDPLTDGSLADYDVQALDLAGMATRAAQGHGLSRADAARTKNMLALGLVSWLFSREPERTLSYLDKKFHKHPSIRDANKDAFRAGYSLGETLEGMAVRYQVPPAPTRPGTYRQISGNRALALGLMSAAARADLELFLGAYPITPATDILAELANAKEHGVMTFQAEDEIAAIGAALGASYAGRLGVTSTSGPGMALKTEMLGLAVMLELPLVVVDVQRAGPSTGMPTRTEQADLNLALFGRHGEAPLPVIAAFSPGDCFAAAYEAARIAIEHRTPVILLSDAYLANGAEPWLVPDLDALPAIEPRFATASDLVEGTFAPYARDSSGARPWALPGTPGLEHRIGGLEKAAITGAISYDPDNHAEMVRQRQAKVDAIVVPNLEVNDPTGDADVLVVGWGSTWGPIDATARRVRKAGHKVATAHLRNLSPLPANTGDVLRAYRKVVVAEMNTGQLAMVLRAKYLVDAQPWTWVRGQSISPRVFASELLTIVQAEENR